MSEHGEVLRKVKIKSKQGCLNDACLSAAWIHANRRRELAGRHCPLASVLLRFSY